MSSAAAAFALGSGVRAGDDGPTAKVVVALPAARNHRGDGRRRTVARALV